MRRSRSVVIGLLAIVVGAVLLAVVRADGGSPASAPRDRGSDAAARAGNDESQEEGDLTASRLDALAEAKAEGKFGAKAVATDTPAPGWVGSRLLNAATDDWEPAVAADPKAPYVYMLTTRYGQPKTCSSHCPTPYLALTTSKDGGTHLGRAGTDVRLSRRKGAVRPHHRGRAEHGRRLLRLPERRSRRAPSRPRSSSPPTTARTWIGTGARLRQRRLDGQARGDDGRRRAGTSTSRGTALRAATCTSASRMTSAPPGRSRSSAPASATTTPMTPACWRTARSSSPRAASPTPARRPSISGQVWHHAIISRNRGATWENVVVAKVPVGEPCVADGCGPDFYTGQASVVAGRRRATWCSPSKGRRPTAVRSGCRSRRRPTRVAPGARAAALSAAGEDATGPRLGSSGGAATCGSGTCRPRAATTRMRGTSGIAARPNGGAQLVVAGQDRRCPRGRGRLRERRRLRRDLRRLRRDRRHQRRQDDRRLGRGLQLQRARRHLVQPAEVSGRRRRFTPPPPPRT